MGQKADRRYFAGGSCSRGTAAPAEAASKNHTAVVAQDNYRKTLCKGFWERVMAVWLMESAVTAVDTHGQP